MCFLLGHGAYVCEKDNSWSRWKLECGVTTPSHYCSEISELQPQSSCQWLPNSRSDVETLCQIRAEWLPTQLGALSTCVQRSSAAVTSCRHSSARRNSTLPGSREHFLLQLQIGPSPRQKVQKLTLLTGSPFKAKLIECLKDKKADGRYTAKRPQKNKNIIKKTVSSNTAPPTKRPKVRPNVKHPKATDSCANGIDDNDVYANCGFIYGEPDDPLIGDEWLKCAKWCHISCGQVRKNSFPCHNTCM